MADKKITSLTAATQPTQDDLLLIVDSPTTANAAGMKITVANFTNNLQFITASTSSVEALKMTVTANNSHTGNTVTAGAFRTQKGGNFTGLNQYGVIAESLLQVAGANVVGLHAAGYFNVDVGESANTGNAYGIIVDTGKANSSWTRAQAPLAFIAFGDDSPGTQGTQYLFEVGRPTKNVSSNATANAGNTGVIFTTSSDTANTEQVTHKLKFRVNGTDFWFCVSNTA